MNRILAMTVAALGLGAASPAPAQTDAAKVTELRTLLNCGVAYQAYSTALGKTPDPDASTLLNQFKTSAPGLAKRIDILADALGQDQSTGLAQEAVDGWNQWLTNNSGKPDWPAVALKTYRPAMTTCIARAQSYN